ncbi:uncharacterized protein FIBRA_07001 [Fibroporia radiculosa]|uniref:Uncharacterized protein n=1 Tax=Fibroporia radiculosa TaxID=599839 RepID=J4GD48_9APHY|nr:uncharacterized protein FIBRA_07001 [Fibroporia radiculosa]CCM04808.1 predicted protein [Fibroporia radiculosa]
MASLFPPPGPGLPSFRTMLFKGPYHASAPIHLMLSHVASNPKSKALMLSPSRQSLALALVDFNDEWLNTHGADGATCDASSRVNILYPPTRAHYTLLLSMLHTHQGTFHHPKTTLPISPSLLILHEISALGIIDQPEATLASYLSLISHALTAVNHLAVQSSIGVALAVFDSGLENLKLPVLRPISPGPGDQSQPATLRKESIAMCVEKYFEWTGTAERKHLPLLRDSVTLSIEHTIVLGHSNSSPTEAHANAVNEGKNMRMVFRREQDSPPSEIIWTWVLRMRPAHVGDDKPGGKYFEWIL